MNVAFDPWIPVVSAKGERELASICTVLTDGAQFSDLAVRPHERISLMRLFLCVAHAALDGPKDYDKWCEVPNRLPEAALSYLTHWKDSFELFHEEKPWLQVALLNTLQSPGKGKSSDNWLSLNALCFTRASGITSTLFDHESNRSSPTEYTPSEIALNLLTFQNFLVAGGKAPSRVWGETEMENPPYPKGGPCSGKSILFTLLRGNNLLDTIHLNLNTYEDLTLLYGNHDGWLGKPLWEIPIKSPTDIHAITNATQTHIGRLVPQTRILRVHKDRKRVLLGAGFLYPKYQDKKNTFIPDLFATTVINKQEERELLSARPGKSIWRELHSLMVRRKDASNTGQGPLCLMNVPDTSSCDIIVNAMITNPKQPAEIVDFIESVFRIPSSFMASEGTASYESEVKNAEALASRLGWAIETYRNEVDGGWEGRLKGAGAGKGELKAKLHTIATNFYWTTVKKNLPSLMTHIKAIGTDTAISTREAWRKMLFMAALDAYRTACGQETPRQIHAFVVGQKKLLSVKNETKEEPKEEST